LPKRRSPSLHSHQQLEFLQPESAVEPGVSASPAQAPIGTGGTSSEPEGSAILPSTLVLHLRNLAAGAHPVTRLRALRGIRLFIDAAFEVAEVETVRAARSTDESWASIGDALGMAGQNAAKKFRGRVK
jgi:hypothetical protein